MALQNRKGLFSNNFTGVPGYGSTMNNQPGIGLGGT